MINLESIGAIIYNRSKEIKYLILEYGYGHWDFPRGLVEKNETEKETAIRELFEETHIKNLKFISGFKEKTHFFYKYKGELVKKEVIYYLAETKAKKIKLSFEHIGYKWLNYNDALKQLTFKNSREILKKANSMLKNSLLNY